AARHGRPRLPGRLRDRARRAPVTGHALDRGVRAVNVDEALGRKAAPLVEAVDVLRDEERDAAGARQVGEREVRGVGLGRADQLPGLALVAPVRLARALAGEELGERDGLVALPAARPPPASAPARA